MLLCGDYGVAAIETAARECNRRVEVPRGGTAAARLSRIPACSRCALGAPSRRMLNISGLDSLILGIPARQNSHTMSWLSVIYQRN
jgi:hypothetical protein